MRHGWSLEKATWLEVSRLYDKKPWRRVRFAAHHRLSVPPEPGVYAICTAGSQLTEGLLSKLYNAVYVGQAVDLRQRFLKHATRPGRELQRAVNAFSILDFF